MFWETVKWSGEVNVKQVTDYEDNKSRDRGGYLMQLLRQEVEYPG